MGGVRRRRICSRRRHRRICRLRRRGQLLSHRPHPRLDGIAGLYRQPVASRQRQGFRLHPYFLQAQSARTEHQCADRLLDLAGRGASGLPVDPVGRMRHGAGRSGAIECLSAKVMPASRAASSLPTAIAEPSTPTPQGTIFGSGVGIVLLKRLKARARGSAITSMR